MITPISILAWQIVNFKFSRMRKKFTLILLVISFVFFRSSAQVNSTDSLALVSLYNNTTGSSWTNKTGWLTGPVSTWFGVTLTGSRVSAIDLSNNNLNGTIPTALGNIANLTSLSLGHNHLSGSIPTALSSLSNLNALVLGGNQLTGTIPAVLGNLSNLTYLDLSSNQLTGSIPTALGTPSFINTLYLNNNQLSGTIPTELGNLSNLGDLELNNNQLSGNIPASFSTLFSLTYLDLSTNQLSGSIPASLGGLFNLNVLNLYSNQLTGTIPSALSGLSSLQSLNLSNNQLNGTIPSSLSSISSLTGINLSINQLTGTVPYSFGKNSFFFFDVSHNQLTGVPTSLKNMTSASVAVNNNKLVFDSLESIVTVLPAGTFSDSPQATISLRLNGNILSTFAGGTLANDTFHWYRNGVSDTTIIGDSTYSPQIFAQYFVIVKNKVVTPASGLSLHSDTLTAGTVILPVSFLSFKGSLVADNSLLQWKVSSEINTSYYNIQRSTDGVNFTTVGKVNAISNSTGDENYQFTDPLTSFMDQSFTFYYRLQEIEQNNNSKFSDIITIEHNTNTSSVIIYPDPVKTDLNLMFNNRSGKSMISIFDISGRKIMELQRAVEQGSAIHIDASAIKAGVYILQVNMNGVFTQQQFIKQ